MFSGIVEHLGSITEVREEPPGRRLGIDCGPVAADAGLGDSICVCGCCLTVVDVAPPVLWFEAGPETLACTTLGRFVPGTQVNLERSMSLGDRIGGHLVSGHVDAVGTLDQRQEDGEWSVCWFRLPARLSRQLAAKGSIAIDGVSLTLVDVEPERFSVALIPHTLAVTTLGTLEPGDPVNLETDLLAKYVERQLAAAGRIPDLGATGE